MEHSFIIPCPTVAEYLIEASYDFKHSLAIWIRDLILGTCPDVRLDNLHETYAGDGFDWEDYLNDIQHLTSLIDLSTLRDFKNDYPIIEAKIAEKHMTVYCECNAIDCHTIKFSITGVQ